MPLGFASERLSDIIGRPEASSNSSAFPQTMKEGDFDEFGNDTAPGEWTRIATFTVPAQEAYRWGYGRATNAENQGYMYVSLNDDTGTAVDGKLRIAQSDAQERRQIVVVEEDVATLSGSKFDKEQQRPLPEQVDKPMVGRDSKLTLEFQPSEKQGAATIVEEQSEVSLPVTNYAQ